MKLPVVVVVAAVAECVVRYAAAVEAIVAVAAVVVFAAVAAAAAVCSAAIVSFAPVTVWNEQPAAVCSTWPAAAARFASVGCVVGGRPPSAVRNHRSLLTLSENTTARNTCMVW